MWSHFILAVSLLATFIECRQEQNNKKLKAAIKENYDEYKSFESYEAWYKDQNLPEGFDKDYFQKPEENKVIFKSY